MKKLVFVYNGDSGVVNGVLHYLHKRISPSTYPCELCGMIYDGMTQKKEWLDFVKSLGVATEFLHRDEYVRQYAASTIAWPAVLLHDDQRLLSTVLGAEDFTRVDSLPELQRQLARFVSGEFGDAAQAA